MNMSAELITSSEFPKDRIMEKSNISSTIRSAGDDDDEICGEGAERTKGVVPPGLVHCRDNGAAI